MAKTGPKPKAVNADHVRSLAAIHCTLAEIAAVCGVSVDTLQRRFAKEIEIGRATGRSSLRRVQWKAAEAGNATMQIWLGKQILGQKDVVEVDGRLDIASQDRHAMMTRVRNNPEMLRLARQLQEMSENAERNESGKSPAA